MEPVLMLFAIHAVDRDGALSERLAHYDAHKAFLSDTSAFGVRIVMSGPLVSDDGQTMIGSLFLIEAEDRAAVERFHAADPFKKAGIWARVTITGFIRRQG
ncbi:YCII-related protein [Azorhizobium caulinodans ORS 571]|uniref:YCII-related protein n=2 Tax=Xanthobacteraceae TaxID=335928 RepID=A8I1U3_AZOC5|nr:YCII-related protein [Azorhizobium caulinodans ORS 571]